jgi:tetratricopeptide (TPR) repeat protein
MIFEKRRGRWAGAWNEVVPRLRDAAGRVVAFAQELDTTTAVALAVVVGVATAVLLYFHPPWRSEADSAPPALDLERTHRNLAEDPLDHATRLELARYYLQWGLAVSRSQMPIDELVSDSELVAYFEDRLREWEKLGEDVSPLRDMLRNDFAGFRNRFVTEERALSKGMFEQSVILFRQTRALGANLSARDLYDLGTAYYQLGPEGYEGAAKFLGEAVSKGLVSARALTFLGNVAVARGDFDGGIALYRKALDYAPDDPILAFNLALAYKERGNYAPAIEFLRATIRIYQDKENLVEDELSIILQSRLALGWCLLKQNRFPEAIEQFETLLEGQPDLVEAYYWLGVAYEGQGRYELAKVHWQRVVRLRPGFRDVNERLAGLERVLGASAGGRPVVRR